MRLTQCCCGCSVRTGTIVIGYFHTFAGFIALAAFITATYMTTGIPPDFERDVPVMVAFGICSVVSLIQFVVSVSLIYGGYTGKRGFLLPWKIFAWINFGLVVVAAVLTFIILLWMEDTNVLIAPITQLIPAALLWYFITVVSSYEESLLVQQTSVLNVANEDPGTNVNHVNNA